MGKAEEAVAKRKSKAVRKRMRRAGTPGATQAIIAAKRRRKAGNRRVCEAMCYSLPTPEDPFNDRSQGKRKKKRSNDDDDDNEELVSLKRFKREEEKDIAFEESEEAYEELSQGSEDSTPANPDSSTDDDEHSEDGDRKNLVKETHHDRRLLSKIANSSEGAEIAFELISPGFSASKDRPQKPFWEACQKGLDVIATVGDSGKVPALAYVPAAVNQIAKHPARSWPRNRPLALFLVASQQEALAVRNLCKPLKESLGLQAISIHPGTSIQHQVEGLKASEAQIMVSTPERLCELLAMKSLSLASVSFLVVENLDALIQSGFQGKLQTIKSHTLPTAQVVVFSERFSNAAISVTRDYVEEPVTRVSGKSWKSRGACIAQDVSVVIDDSKKSFKVLSLLRQHQKDRKLPPPTVILARRDEDVKLLTTKLEGVKSAGSLTTDLRKDTLLLGEICEGFSRGSLNPLVAAEEMLKFIDLSGVEMVINLDCPSSMEIYGKLLSSMARASVHGSLHTFCGCSSASMAGHLVNVLEECSQPVPTALQMLADAASVVIKSCKLGK